MATAYWTARGSVRGSCRHQHRTMGTAARCAARDQRDCASLGGGAYSDRVVVHVVDGHAADLSDDQMRALDDLMEAR